MIQKVPSTPSILPGSDAQGLSVLKQQQESGDMAIDTRVPRWRAEEHFSAFLKWSQDSLTRFKGKLLLMWGPCRLT